MNIASALHSLVPTLLFCAAVVLGSDPGQTNADVWGALHPFLGTWKGDVKGEPGNGKAERTYSFTLRNRFIQITNKSVYPPQEKNPKGEIHEDIGVFSYDSRAKKFMLRQFHVEGFVNELALETLDEKRRTLVFLSIAIENIAPGWRAREIYHFVGNDEFVETFALAEPGKDFATYSETHFRRQRHVRGHSFENSR